MDFKIYRKIVSLTIVLFICFFPAQILVSRETPVPSPSRNEPNNLFTTVSPSITKTPVVILPPRPVSTQIPSGTCTPVPYINLSPGETTVMLNHRPVIKIYADSELSASDRAYILERRLEEVLERAEKSPYVKISIVEDTPVLESEGVYLISVTNRDAAYSKMTVSQLTAHWRDELQKSLDKAVKEKGKGYEREAFIYSVIAIITGILLTIAAFIICHKWIKRPAYFMILLVWLLIIYYILWIFPVSRSWSKGLLDYILNPILTLIIILVIIDTISRPLDQFIKHYFDLTKKLKGHEIIENARATHRLTMFKLIISLFIKTGLYIVGGLIFLKSLHVDLATGLAGAGIIGVGLGIAAQDLLKDIVAGSFIVIEDQFAVGDVIRTGNFTGTVEDFNMRVTRIRDMGGSLITIPNSTIRVVENFSSTWSQVDCIIGVTYNTDLKKAMDIMVETGRKLKDEHPEKVLEDPVMLGVNELADSSIKLRMLLKTAPSEQWQFKRELYLRVKNAFDREGIEIAFPQLTVWMNRMDKGEKI
ncbi:MAG TPA: mechanosensitive ion channel family protein [Candidatus Eremiobacteraeota bacterium]|nr:mechanosensitive ion channel family protein [Candidatus Eremiobacteraeota bacterium]